MLTAGAGAALLNSHDSSSHHQAAPEKLPPPVVEQNNLDGLGGKGVPGTTIVLTRPDGSTVTTSVDEDGNWKFQPNPLGDGQEGTVTNIDDKGGTSDPVDTGKADVTPPDAPEVTQNNADGIVGTSDEPGGIVVVELPDGSTVTTIVDKDGNWKLEPNPLNHGEEAKITVMDPAGNVSNPTNSERGVLPPSNVEVETTGDNEVTVTGEAEPGTEITVTFPDGTTATAITDKDGNFEVVVKPAPDGSGEVEVIAKDKDGNSSDPTPEDYVDVTPPTPPTVEVDSETEGEVTVGGSSDPNTDIVITFPDGTTATTTTDENGNYSVVVKPAPDGSGDVVVEATDKDGNSSQGTGDYEDKTPPSGTVTIESAIDDVAPVEGTLENNSSTNDKQPMLIGKVSGLTANDVVVVKVDGKVLGEATVNSDGTWSYQVSSDLAEGDHVFTAVVVDSSGNEGLVSNQFNLNVDVTAPDAGLLELVINDVTADNVLNAEEAKGSITLTGQVVAKAGGEFLAGDVVTLVINGKNYTAKVDADGKWSVDVLGSDLAADPDSIIDGTFVATDAAGNSSSVTGSKDYTNYADGSDVSVTVGLDPVTEDNTINGAEHGNGVTFSGSLSGKYDEVTSVKVTINGVEYDAQFTNTGWTLTLGKDQLPATDGNYDIKVDAEVRADSGNTATDDATGNFDVMLGADLSVTVTVDKVTADGIVNIDEKEAGVELTGTVQTTGNGQLSMTVTINGQVFTEADGLVINEAEGTWSLALPESLLDDGNYSVQVNATVTDTAGNSSPGQASNSYIVSLSSPEDVVIKIDVIAEDDILNNSESQPDQNHIIKGLVTGEFQAGDEVVVVIGDFTTTTVVDENGEWSITVSGDILAGSDSVKASITASNIAGNTTVANDSRDYVVDLIAPNKDTTVLEIFNITDDNVINVAESQEAQTLVSGRVTGEFAEGDVVTLTINGETYTADVAEDGTWSVPVNTSDLVNDPDFTIEGEVLATDKAGNQGVVPGDKVYSYNDGSSLVGNITINTIAEDNIINGSEAAAGVTITGTVNGEFVSVQGGQVKVIINGQEYLTTVDENNNWSLTLPAEVLGEGSYHIDAEAVVVDASGNVADAKGMGEYVVDLTAPDDTTSAIHINDIAGDNILNAEESAVDQVITGTVSGEFTVGDKVIVTVGGETYETTVLAGSEPGQGTWSVTVPGSVLANDQLVVATFQPTDKAGNTGSVSDKQPYLVDVDAPAAPTVEVIDNTGDITGPVGDGATTDETQPLFQGKGEAGATLTLVVSDDNGVIFTETVVVDKDGNWSIESPVELTEGEYTVTASQTDVAGNTGPEAGQAFEVDTTGPNADELELTINNVTDDNLVSAEEAAGQIEISGKVEGEFQKGNVVTLTINGNTYTAEVEADGTWSVMVEGSDLAADSDHIIDAQFVASDVAGNKTTINETHGYTYSDGTQLNVTVTIDTLAGDNVVNAEEKAAGDLVLSGTLDGTYDNIEVIVDINGTTYVATVNGTTWELVLPDDVLVDGESYDVNVTANISDTAGNTDSGSATSDYSVDTTPPNINDLVLTINNVTDDNVINASEAAGQVEVTGKVEGEFQKGNIVTLTINGNTYTAEVEADGTWSAMVEGSDLAADSDHTIDASFTASDTAGNTTTVDETHVYTYSDGSQLNVTVSLESLTEDNVVNAEEKAAGDVVLSGKLSGTYDNVEVIVDINGTTYVATVSGDGWTLVLPEAALADGTHDVKVTANISDTVGNTDFGDTAGDYSVDTQAPTAEIEIKSITEDSGRNTSDFVTNDNTLIFSGTLSEELGDDEYVEISLDGGATWTRAQNSGLTWSYDNTGTELDDDSYDVQVRVVDEAGNIGNADDQLVVVDTQGPDLSQVAIVVSITDDTGIAIDDFITNDNTLIFNGEINVVLPEDETVEISLDGGLTWHETVVSGQTWTFDNTANELDDGSYDVVVRIVDTAGNEGTRTNKPLLIDTQAPDMNGLDTSISISTDTSHGLDTPFSDSVNAKNTDMVTRDQTVTVQGELTNGLRSDEHLQISIDNGRTWVTVISGSGVTQWSYDLPEATADTTTNVLLQVVDTAGNVGINTGFEPDGYTVVVDLTSPDALTMAPNVDQVVSTDTEFTFTSDTYGRAEAGALVALISDVNDNGSYQEGLDKVIGWARVNEDGNWSLVTKLPAGAHNLAFMVWDDAGNRSALSETVSVGVTDGSGSLIVDTGWGGNTDGNEGRGVNSAAVTIGSNGLWSFFQNAGRNGGRVYQAQDQENYESTKLAAHPDANGTGYGGYINSAAFFDVNRDGLMDVMGQVSDYGPNIIPYWVQNADGSFTTTGVSNRTTNGGSESTHLGGVIAVDLNGNGYLDTFVADSAPDTVMFFKNNNGTLEAISLESNPYGFSQGQYSMMHEIGAVDLNNNGFVDITAHIPLGRGDSGRGLGVFVNKGDGYLYQSDVVTYEDIFRGNAGDDYGNLAISMTWADFNNDGFMDLFLAQGHANGGGSGSSSSNDSTESRLHLNDGKGNLLTSDSDIIWFGDDMDGGTSLAVDWNHDGKVDIIEVPRQNGTAGGARADANSPSLYLNDGSGTWGSSQALTQDADGNPITYTDITGAVALDYDWDGSMDLVLYRRGGNREQTENDDATNPTLLVKNTNIAADGTALHIRILDHEGINAFNSNTVHLYNSAGERVASQMISPQGSGSSNTMALVSFYGLDPDETYSVQLLRITYDEGLGRGVANHVGAYAQQGSDADGNAYTNGTINSTWGGLTTGKSHDAYVLTAEADGDATATVAANGIQGTGYNDTFFAGEGAKVYNGGGGWDNIVSGEAKWSEDVGMDTVSYEHAGNRDITVDLSNSAQQNTGYGSAKFISIEGLIGSAGNDTFTDNGANNIFDGRGGDDTYYLTNGGNDTILFTLIDDADATGGNGHDTIYGFTVGDLATNADADLIDLSELLDYKGSVSFYQDTDGLKLDYSSQGILDYLKTETRGTDTVISIDRDGKGGAHDFTEIVTLKDTDTDLLTLLQNNQIMV